MDLNEAFARILYLACDMQHLRVLGNGGVSGRTPAPIEALEMQVFFSEYATLFPASDQSDPHLHCK